MALHTLSISSNPNSLGLHGHILIAEDGEAWQLGRTRSGNHPTPWQRGEIIEVPVITDPIRDTSRPDWQQLHCEIPQQLADAPPNVVAEVWGTPVDVQAGEPVPQREVEPSIVFTADQFTPTQWNTAQDKADYANAFVKFLENGFRLEHLPDEFYTRLCQTFGHIAHFDGPTFYRTFLATAVDNFRFVKQTVDHEPVGDPAFTFSDMEKVVREYNVFHD